MNNYKLTIQYDGTDFAGWQIQKKVDSVQQTITDSIKILFKEEINLIGSGRTDAGVHAWGQIANFRIAKSKDLYYKISNIEKFRYSLNSILPQSINIKNIESVNESFHARFDAKRRSYFYVIAKDSSPFYLKFSYLYPIINKYDICSLNNLSNILLGEHDFTSFARKNTETKNKVCNIYNINWRETKDFVFFFVEANRFLHGMVKTLVGTILQNGRIEYDKQILNEILNAKDREAAGKAFPSKGLFLFKVRYLC